ncbi:hypothetical protein ACFL6S_23335, partial [Candidatus Poribacteria bacterium]
HYIGRILKTIFDHDPLWVIGFFEKRVERKILKDDRDYNAIPYGALHEFINIDWETPEKVLVLRRVMKWTEESPASYRLWEAPRLLKNLIREKESPLAVHINKPLENLLADWANSGQIERIRRCAYILRDFAEDPAFYSLVEKMLLKSNGDNKVKEDLMLAITSEGYTRGLGQPAQIHLERLSYLKKLRDRADSPIVREFAQKMIQSTEHTIKEELQRDEELLDE